MDAPTETATPATRPWDRDELPSGEEKSAAVQEMFDTIAPRYDMVNRIMTFRLDVRWRRRALRTLALAPDSRVLDLASGTGDLCVELLAAGLRPVSVDFSHGMLVADRSGAPRVQADILRLPVGDGAADGATCGFALRNLVDLEQFFAELARVVRHGGRIALLDVGVPHNPVMRWATASTSGTSSPASGGCSPIRGPTATCRRASPTCRRQRTCWRCCAAPASTTPGATNSRAASPSCSRPRGADALMPRSLTLARTRFARTIAAFATRRRTAPAAI